MSTTTREKLKYSDDVICTKCKRTIPAGADCYQYVVREEPRDGVTRRATIILCEKCEAKS